MKRTTNIIQAAVAVLAFACFPLSPAAQAATASISGQTTIAGTNPAYPGPGITLTLVGNGPQLTSVTDANGNYGFSGLNAGRNGLKIKIRDALYLDLNKDLDALSTGNSVVNISIIPRLTLTPLCSVNPSASRHWSVHNPLPAPVSFQWVLKHPSNQTGSGVAFPGDTTFDTPAVAGSNLVQLLVSQAVVDQKNSPGQICCTGSLSGSVTDTSNAPLGNVQIAIIDASNATVTTVSSQANGSYSANNLLAGTYSMVFAHTGYQSATLTGILVVCNVSTSVPAVQLTPNNPPPSATVDVTVIENVTQAPISGATVTITYSSGPNPAAQTTDGNGLADFTNQPIGVGATVTVTTNDGSNRVASQTISGGFASGPNSVLIGINPVPKGSISGTVTSHTGSPLGNVAVSVIDPSNLTIASGSTMADGTYSIGGIVAGTYNMSFTLQNYTSVTLPAVTVTNGGNTVENATLTPVAGTLPASLTITVLDGGFNPPTPISGATVTLSYTGAPPQPPSGTTDGNGNVSFDSSTPGLTNGLAVSFTVGVNDCFGRNVTQTVTLSIDGGDNPVTVVVNAAPSGSIVGNVTDSATSSPLANVTVNVTDASNITIVSASTDASGNYSISGLETCTYQISFALAGYQPTTVSGVVVTAGGTTTQNAALMH
jgi:hypothetical protein